MLIEEEIGAPNAATQPEQDFLGAEIARTSVALNQRISQRGRFGLTASHMLFRGDGFCTHDTVRISLLVNCYWTIAGSYHFVLNSSCAKRGLVCISHREVLQRSTMFIALRHQYLCAPAERYVLWRIRYMPLLRSEIDQDLTYKHVAPPEQEPLETDDDPLSGKAT